MACITISHHQAKAKKAFPVLFLSLPSSYTMSKSPITCHVLDSTLGRPAQGVAVSLEALSGSVADAKVLAEGWVE